MQKVRVVDVGPRDGFQNVKEFIPTQVKLEVIDKIVKAGVKKLQLTSFVSPKAIPQMQDAREVAQTALQAYPFVELFALVPNLRGAQAASEAGLKEVSFVMSLSESHNKANVNRTVAESLEEARRIRRELPDMHIVQDIATAFGCPFEGWMEVGPLVELVGKLSESGIDEFTLCDTIGVAYPAQVRNVMETLRGNFPALRFNLHIHDTRNLGILNTYVGLECGAYGVQTTLGGLGGCPFAPGASGNTATEDLVYLLNRDGYDTGIDTDDIIDAAKFLYEHVEGNYSGHHIHIAEQRCKF